MAAQLPGKNYKLSHFHVSKMGEALQTEMKSAENTSINMQLTFLSFLCCFKQLLNDSSSKFCIILQTTHSAHLALFINSLLADVSEMSNSIQIEKKNPQNVILKVRRNKRKNLLCFLDPTGKSRGVWTVLSLDDG